jgi:hypothetical protein
MGTGVFVLNYDFENRLIEEKIDADGDGDIDHETCYAYDGNQIVLQFDKEGAGDVVASNLSHRYLWGGLLKTRQMI